MRFILLYAFVVVLMSYCPASAAPSKKAATDFIREMELAVKAGDGVIQNGSGQALNDHSKRIESLYNKSSALFFPSEPSGACIYAAGSANRLWIQRRLQLNKPTEAGYGFIKRAAEDHQDNLKLCKEAVGKLK